MTKMDVRTLVYEAAVNGVTLWVEDGQLRFKAPKGKMTGALRNSLRSKKRELIGNLSVPIFKRRSPACADVRFPACQKGFWEEIQANTSLRHCTHIAMRVTGEIEPNAVESTFKRLSLRHDLLRSRLRLDDDGIPVLQLHHEVPMPIEMLDLSWMTGENLSSQLDAAIQRVIYAPFDDGSVYRAQVIKISDCEHVMAVVIHHFVADAVTLELIAGELLSGMLGLSDSSAHADEDRLQYADYLFAMNEWLAGQGLLYRLDLWKEHMRGAQEVCFPRVEQRATAGPSRLDVLEIHVGKELRAKLSDVTAVSRVPLASIILAANFAALASAFRRRDLFAVFLHMGRNEPALYDLVGFTANCFPVRVTIAPQMPYADLLTHVHDAFVFARDHQVPWGVLMPLLGEIGASSTAPLFNYRSVARLESNSSIVTSRGKRFEIEPIVTMSPQQTNSVDWKSYELYVRDSGAEMSVCVKYMPAAYDAGAVRSFAHTLEVCLKEIGDNPAGHLAH